jgi:hypothetical protein
MASNDGYSLRAVLNIVVATLTLGVLLYRLAGEPGFALQVTVSEEAMVYWALVSSLASPDTTPSPEDIKLYAAVGGAPSGFWQTGQFVVGDLVITDGRGPSLPTPPSATTPVSSSVAGPVNGGAGINGGWRRRLFSSQLDKIPETAVGSEAGGVRHLNEGHHYHRSIAYGFDLVGVHYRATRVRCLLAVSQGSVTVDNLTPGSQYTLYVSVSL